MSENSWDLPPDKKQEIIDFEKKLQGYNKYVSEQTEGFEFLINWICDVINGLRDEEKIAGYFNINARIKDFTSALMNDEKKTLDDVFGIEIISETSEDVFLIMNQLLKYMRVKRQKDHNKTNGYEAKHRVLALTEEAAKKIGIQIGYNNIPIVEIQFKTREVAEKCHTGSANHLEYKGITQESVQAEYDKGRYTSIINVPTMWVYQDGRMIKLSSRETLKKIYPFLILNERIKFGEEKP